MKKNGNFTYLLIAMMIISFGILSCSKDDIVTEDESMKLVDISSESLQKTHLDGDNGKLEEVIVYGQVVKNASGLGDIFLIGYGSSIVSRVLAKENAKQAAINLALERWGNKGVFVDIPREVSAP